MKTPAMAVPVKKILTQTKGKTEANAIQELKNKAVEQTIKKIITISIQKPTFPGEKYAVIGRLIIKLVVVNIPPMILFLRERYFDMKDIVRQTIFSPM